MASTIRKQTALWTQRNGIKIRICDMSDRHLCNAIKLLSRCALRQLEELPYPSFIGEEAQNQAEDAYETMHQMNDEELSEEFFPISEKLHAEKARRKL